jgi:hypothetical protein
MRSIILHDTQIVARVVKNSPTERGIQMFLIYLNLRNKANKSTHSKYVLSYIINNPDDVIYPVDDRNRNLNKLVINNMWKNYFVLVQFLVLLPKFKYTFNGRILNILSSLSCSQQPTNPSSNELLLSTQFKG